MNILGLDISTSTVGFAIIDTTDMNIVALGHWSLKNKVGLLNKADVVLDGIKELLSKHNVHSCVWIEEPVMRFAPGMSSAQTITMLVGFNAMVTYGIHSLLGLQVAHVKPGDARRSCGLYMTTKAKSGNKSQKEQVYCQLTSHPSGLLANIKFPLTKTQKPKPENYDEADAYVVARHGAIASLK
jgi:Holliday junction resolvasome RuvABC endonuclease subunit